MILSNEDIRRALEEGRVVIDPLPDEEMIDTSSVDLRIGEPLWMWNPDLVKEDPVRIDVDHMNFKDLTERYLVEAPRESSGKYLIEPQQVYLASTHEKVHLPMGSQLAARVEGKSGLARLGLSVHMTAPTIHCGTGLGIITLEILNSGPFTLEVTPGSTRICQFILEEVSSEPVERAVRTFAAQKTPKG